ncbi:DUF5641 domain-containing protein [Trichonephila clavipes]|nr:DUF5641 domain-containing protein [Trichonephila clavipes]
MNLRETYLRIVWKDSIDDYQTYRMNRVVYGTTCAPFLAQRVLKQLVTDDGHTYPLAASAVSADIFMDDLISGCSSISSAKQPKQELISLFSGAGMQLHKCSQAFVKNRVSVIQHLTEVSSWKHVQSQEDPADIISRGIDPDKIQDSVLWWYGPSGLQGNPVVSTCDVSEINENDLYLREFKKSDPVCLVTQNVELLPIINKCSSFVKLKRILAWCLRFKENARNHSSQRTIGSLTATE